MAAAAALFNHSTNTALEGSRVVPMASAAVTTGTTSSSDASSAGISANDFLTLLVTEMKNQDPTANTDPNQYINQLVNVNSLEQLININQTLSSALGTSDTSTTGTAQAAKTIGNSSPDAGRASAQPATQGTAGNTAIEAAVNRLASGNLTVPHTKPAAQNIAHALDGHSHKLSFADGLSTSR